MVGNYYWRHISHYCRLCSLLFNLLAMVTYISRSTLQRGIKLILSISIVILIVFVIYKSIAPKEELSISANDVYDTYQLAHIQAVAEVGNPDFSSFVLGE